MKTKKRSKIMHIDITALLKEDLFRFSHSVAEGGDNAGRNTWNAALEDAKTRRPPLLDTPEKIEAFHDWVRDFGAWDDDEIAAWSEDENNALFLQFIAGDVREAGADDLGSLDWDEYQKDAEAGRAPSYLYKDESGRIFYDLHR